MPASAAFARLTRIPLTFRSADGERLAWRAQLYVGVVVAIGMLLILRFLPRELPHPLLGAALLSAAVGLSVFKLRLPLGKGASTMSMAHAVDFAALVMVGPDVAMVIAAVGVLVQCTVRVQQAQPAYRAAFSMASIVIAVQSAGWAWALLGGDTATPSFSSFVVPLSGAAIAYFAVNTALVAGAIAVTTAMSAARQWYREFFWSAPAYFLSAAVAGMVALIINHDTYVLLPLAASPLYISYRAYRMSVERLEDERTHARELAEMIGTAQKALVRATQSEAALAAEKERLAVESGRLSVTLRTISDGVVSVDRQGAVLLMNEGAEALTGFHDLIEERPVHDVLAALGLAPQVCRQAVQQVLDDGLPVRLRTEPGDEQSRLVEVTGTPNRDADGQVAGAVWVLRDLTDLTRIEHERARIERLESLGVLAGGLAHDFNNILMGVVGNLSLAQSMTSPDDTALLERLTSAATACNRARGVTNQLLTFSKGGAPVKTAASIHELVTECARFCLSGSPVAPHFDVPADVCSAEVDTGQISQVVQNLVLNALQAMMPSGGILDIALRNVDVDDSNQPSTSTPLLPGRYVRVAVTDRGHGISPEHLSRIFDPYFTTKAAGSGLGLAISYSIVRAHGGVITVQSEQGIGTQFNVFLPATDKLVERIDGRVKTTTRVASGRVLLMDDEPMVGEVAQEMLEALGYEVEVAASGTQAIERFRAAEARGNPFVAVILDLTVPGGMGGAEAVTHIKAIRNDIPVVVSSGYADDPVMSQYRDYGFDGVLPKPFPIPQLRRVLEELDVAPVLVAA